MQPSPPPLRRRSAVLDATSAALVPLRPLTVGEAMDAAFLIVQRNPRRLLGLPLLVAGALLLVCLTLAGVWFAVMEMSTPVAQVIFGVAVVLAGGGTITLLVMWMQGVLTRSALQMMLGEHLASPRPLTARERLRLVPVALVALVVITGVLSVGGGLVQVVGAVAMLPLLGVGSPALSSLGSLVVSLVTTLLFAYVYAFVSQTLPVYAAEGPFAPAWIGRPRRRQGIFGAVGRSFVLVGPRHAVRVGAALGGAMIVVGVVSILVAVGIAFLAMLFLRAMGFSILAFQWLPVALVALGVSWLAVATVATAYLAALQAVFYLDLRMRREGLDLALRFPSLDVPEPVAS